MSQYISIRSEMSDDQMKSMMIEDAMTRANNYGRKFYKGSIVRIDRVDTEAWRAWNRCRKSRSAIVREAADRLVKFNKVYRYYRYLNNAPMREIELLAQHGCIAKKGGAA